ncbi:toll/interleukin-1 receptor domain-containing protein [Colwellia psychrerythraea]|uniref:TIR protein n=1 Tax=Colwellia psychrerythraea TaxID=28229 RepID=A0A099KG59_COLPS|nr:toll/interleukin-1 receptor domain-containing protein [Colwellia psychrerythraea]KGJ88568.1 TIR protein [Colwellia psychrerythraea]
MKEDQRSYLIELDYGNRKGERDFVKDILSRYDKNTLVGSILFVNNNPYHFELLWFLNFEKDFEDVDRYLASKYPTTKRAYNRFVTDLMASMDNKSYNLISVSTPEDVDVYMTSKTNDYFTFSDRELFFEMWGKPVTLDNFTVFLSHSSKDKEFVDEVFNELQKSEIKAWYDKEEIIAGESVTDNINNGLQKSNFGLIFLSKSFLNGQSGWTIAEANFFMQQRMRDASKKFVIVNIDLPHNEIPPLMQDYRYIDASDDGFMVDIKKAINHHQRRI